MTTTSWEVVGHFGVEVATAIAVEVEADTLPLRIPIGEAARRVLAARIR